jgi:hypothetical protein
MNLDINDYKREILSTQLLYVHIQYQVIFY